MAGDPPVDLGRRCGRRVGSVARAAGLASGRPLVRRDGGVCGGMGGVGGGVRCGDDAAETQNAWLL